MEFVLTRVPQILVPLENVLMDLAFVQVMITVLTQSCVFRDPARMCVQVFNVLH